MPPKLLWITDPWTTLDHPRDTTLRLIEASLALGWESYWCDVQTIEYLDGPRFQATRVTQILPGRKDEAFIFGATEVCRVSDFSHLFYRVDPPVDDAYLHPLLILAQADTHSHACGTTEFINPLSVLLMRNEKLVPPSLQSLLPPTLVSAQAKSFIEFGRNLGKIVIKPLNQAQSKGVALLDWSNAVNDKQNLAVLSHLTHQFSRPAVAQRYLDGIRHGEVRLWYIDDYLLAAVRKLPKSGEFKIDMDAGGSIALTDLTEQELSASKKIGQALKTEGIRLAAVDLIDGYITDFNFTSPGLLVGMESLFKRDLATEVLNRLCSNPNHPGPTPS